MVNTVETQSALGLTLDEENFLSKVREDLQKMDYIPLTDNQWSNLEETDREALTNARLEGLYESIFEKELFGIFREYRVPPSVSEAFVLKFLYADI